MHVLMVTGQLPMLNQPGSMAFVARQIESIHEAGPDVTVLEIRSGQQLKYLRAIPRMWECLRSVDLVHAHYGYCGWVARSQLRRPMVVSFMGDDLLGTPDATGRATAFSRVVVQLNHWLARRVNAVIVKSAEMAQIVAPVRAHVVPNGVDLRAFRPMDSRQARQLLNWAEGKYYILFPGCPDIPRKGFPLAQKAIEKATACLRRSLELVPLWGVPPDQVPLYINACHALIMTSFWEGSPNVVKEVLACNVPVVSVSVGDVPELLEGVDGCAVCSREANTLGAALAQILKEGRRVEGRETIQRKGLDSMSVAQKIVRIYDSVLTQI